MGEINIPGNIPGDFTISGISGNDVFIDYPYFLIYEIDAGEENNFSLTISPERIMIYNHVVEIEDNFLLMV